MFATVLITSTLWWGLLPAMLYVVRRWGGTSARHRWLLVIAVPVGLAWTSLATVWADQVEALRLSDTLRPLSMIDWTNGHVLVDLGFYVATVLAAVAIHLHSLAKGRAEQATHLALRNNELRSELLKAELAALRSRLEPHFISNALNSVQALINTDRGEEASQVVAGIGSLLRRAFRSSDDEWCSLSEELETIREYLGIEKVRFGEALHTEIEVDPDLLSAPVPSLLLHPLVENAVVHAVSARSEGTVTTVRISGERKPGAFEIVVFSSGSHLPAAWRLDQHKGTGLAITVDRLDRTYGSKARLQLENRPGGVAATVTLPSAWTPHA